MTQEPTSENQHPSEVKSPTNKEKTSRPKHRWLKSLDSVSERLHLKRLVAKVQKAHDEGQTGIDALVGQEHSEVKDDVVVAHVQGGIFDVAQRLYGAEIGGYKSRFRDRVAVERQLTRITRSEEKDLDKWDFAEGAYDLSSLYDEKGAKIPTTDDLVGTELAMDTQIEGLLKGRRENDKPVVVVDFGGGLGFSMIRLASKYSREIENGDLVMAVTNLGDLPDSVAAEGGYSGIAQAMKRVYEKTLQTNDLGVLKANLDFIQANQGLVTYIQANSFELPTKTVIPRGKQEIPLLGSVDVLHEDMALRHIHAVDVALAAFGESLSDRGSVYLGTRYTDDLQDPAFLGSKYTGPDGDVINIDQDYKNSREQALTVGKELLQTKYHTTMLDFPDFMMFKKTSA